MIIYTDTFLNQMIQFYLNNAINLHQPNSHRRHVAPQHRPTDRIVTTDYCDVIPSYVQYEKMDYVNTKRMELTFVSCMLR